MKNKVSLLFFFLLFLVLTLISLRVIPFFSISKISTEGFVVPFTMEAELNGLRGTNFLLLSRHGLKRKLESYGYVSNVSFTFKDKELRIKGDASDSTVLVTDGKSALLYDGEFQTLASEDVAALAKTYSLVQVSRDFLNSSQKYGFPENFMELLEALGALKSSSALITIADYDNNKGSIYNGTLRVKLPNVEAELQINDFRDNEMVCEAIDIICNEYYSSKYRLRDVVQVYELSNGQLVRKKR